MSKGFTVYSIKITKITVFKTKELADVHFMYYVLTVILYNYG